MRDEVEVDLGIRGIFCGEKEGVDFKRKDRSAKGESDEI